MQKYNFLSGEINNTTMEQNENKDNKLNTETNNEINDTNEKILDDEVEVVEIVENSNETFRIGLPDILLVLTVNTSNYKDNRIHLISKMVIVREVSDINIYTLAKTLNVINIDNLNIVSVSDYQTSNIIHRVIGDGLCTINYVDMGIEEFKKYLSVEDTFLNANVNTLYIMRNASYLDIKNIFSSIEGKEYNMGRGGSQKAHILSPLDLRLTSYLMAMYKFNYKFCAYLNIFNDIPKNRYLPFTDRTQKSTTKSTNKSSHKSKLDRLFPKETLFTNFVNRLQPNDGKDFLNSIQKIQQRKQFHTSAFNRIEQRKKFQSSEFNRIQQCKQFHTSVFNRNDEGNSVKLENENKNSVFSYLDQIDTIIEKSDSLFDAQNAIETSWITLMKKKLEDPSTSTWRMLPNIIKNSVNTLQKYENKGILKRRFKAINHEISDNKSEIVLLTIAMLISNYNKVSATNISIKIGHNIAFLLFKQNLEYDKSINFRSKFDAWKKIHDLDSNAKLLKLGDYFVNLFTNEPTQIFEFGLDEEDLIETSSEKIIKISPEYINMIKEELIVHPTSLPMICEPVDWNDDTYGGFIDNKYSQNPINTGSSYHGHRIIYKEQLYKAVNSINKTKFNINNELLNYILNGGEYLLEGEDNEKSQLQNKITLKVAKVYAKYDFYLNVNSDWRSRLYTNSFFLTYQGGDLSRSLIEFSKGEKLTEDGLKYLYIFGANCYSNILSKKSFNQRVSWIKNNLSKIIELDKDFINKANKKIQFASFCIAIKNYESDKNFLVKLPVFLDATCSGIQHLAAMLQDIDLGKQVNLLAKNDNDEVDDLYQSVVGPINNEINKFGKENVSHTLLSKVKLNRQIIKPSVMTNVYSVTVDGIYRQLTSKFKKEKVIHPTDKTAKGNVKYNTFYYVPNNKGGETLVGYTDVYKMAEIIKKIPFSVYPSLNHIYNYFIQSAKLMVKLNMPIVWFTPSGLEICQFYYVSKIEKVKLTYFGKTRTSVIREWKGIVDKNKQNQSIVPNIIHSLDASHLINVINSGYSKNIEPIISIHDCFGTHPNKMDNLAKLVRTEFILLYTKHNFLLKYNERVINSIKDNNYEIVEIDGKQYVEYHALKKRKDGSEYISAKKLLYLIPDVPKMGDLDLKGIINAKYLIS